MRATDGAAGWLATVEAFEVRSDIAGQRLGGGVARTRRARGKAGLAASHLTAGSCHHHLVNSPLIDKGVAALRAGDAVTARRVFELAVAEFGSGAALEGLAEALYLQQEYSTTAAH
jgi:hypothetical protein